MNNNFKRLSNFSSFSFDVDDFNMAFAAETYFKNKKIIKSMQTKANIYQNNSFHRLNNIVDNAQIYFNFIQYKIRNFTPKRRFMIDFCAQLKRVLAL